MAHSKVDVLKAEGSTLRKGLIAAMDGGNWMKEQIKALTDELKGEKLLTEQKDKQLLAAKREASKAGDEAVQAFQQTVKYNGVLLGWYFKGFKLLRRYLAKHNLWVVLDNLDLEVVEKEMEAEKAAARDTADERAGDGGDDQAT